MADLKDTQKGFSLIELILSLSIIAVIFSALVIIYEIHYRNYRQGLTRIRVYKNVNNSNLITRYIRSANNINTVDSSYIDLSYYNDTIYIYLYNKNDTYPSPNYNQEYYKLKILEQDTFVYSEGKTISSNITPPPLSYFSYSDSDIIIKFTFNDNYDTITIRKTVNVRNN